MASRIAVTVHLVYQMLMRPLPRTSLADGAYAALLDAIVTGELPPGARLRDLELAERLGTSRTPVREALRRLADEGLVEVVPQAATRVAPVDLERAAHAFPVVAALQALATRLGVPGLTRAGLDAMRRHDADRARALTAGDIPAAIAADDHFHGVLIDASGNAELRRTLDRLMPQIRRLDLLHFRALSRDEAPDDHAAILGACERGAAEEAAALVERTFLHLGEAVAELLRRDGEPG
jgi:DNA-binding GntR family transcriptional regulator